MGMVICGRCYSHIGRPYRRDRLKGKNKVVPVSKVIELPREICPDIYTLKGLKPALQLCNMHG